MGSRGPFRARLLRAGVLVAAAAVTGSLLPGAATAQVPAGATPGGALPELPQAPAVPLPGGESMFPIPPAVERPLDVEEGQRLFVNRFVLKGVIDRPAVGIDPEEISAIVENLRQERLQLTAVDETGFTEPERVEIADFMQKVVADPDLDMRFEDYEALVDKLRAIKDQRDSGLTIGEMQEIAAAVTQYYRSAGYVLAQAFIPAQEVADGVVTIEVLEGKLGRVIVEGNKDYTTEVLAKPFADLIDAPVDGQQVQSAILTAGDYPGVAVFGVFQPGRDVGTTDMVLRVQQERKFDVSVRYDNFGTRFTGDRRLIGDFAWNNFSRAGDQIAVTALKQYKPANAWYGRAQYVRPFLDPRLTWGIAYQRNPFQVAAELKTLELGGETRQGELFTDYAFQRSLDQNVSGHAALRRSNAVSQQGGRVISEDNLSMADFVLNFDNLDREGKAINLGSVGFTQGLGSFAGGCDSSCARSREYDSVSDNNPSRVGGDGRVGSSTFNKMVASFSRLQKLNETQSVLVRVDGQYSGDLLTSTEQYNVGGPRNIRAYNVSEFLADSAAYASFEYSIAAPGFSDAQFKEGTTWGEVLRVSFFLDWVYANLNDPASQDVASRNLYGTGVGVTFDLPGTFLGKLQWAYPLADPVPGAPGDPDKGKWWFDFAYQF